MPEALSTKAGVHCHSQKLPLRSDHFAADGPYCILEAPGLPPIRLLLLAGFGAILTERAFRFTRFVRGRGCVPPLPVWRTGYTLGQARRLLERTIRAAFYGAQSFQFYQFLALRDNQVYQPHYAGVSDCVLLISEHPVVLRSAAPQPHWLGHLVSASFYCESDVKLPSRLSRRLEIPRTGVSRLSAGIYP